jgi:uncharacterized membrane protein YbhN (UPF0104 family)
VWSWLLLVVVAGGGAYLVQRNADVIGETYAAMGWPAMLAAGVLALAGTLTIGMVWRSLLLGTDHAHMPALDGLGTFYVTQLGKYVPGAVWPILAQVAAAKRWGYRRSSVVTANLLMMLMLAASGTLLGLVLLPWFADFGPAWWRWAVVLVPGLVWLLVPGKAASVLRRLPLPAKWRLDVTVSPAASLAAVGWSLMTWLLLGAQLWVLLHAAGARGADTVAAAIGAAGLGYAVGLVVVFAPAGAGAREAVLVAVGAPLVGTVEALAVALACRLLLTLVDVALAFVGGLVGAARRSDGSDAALVEE